MTIEVKNDRYITAGIILCLIVLATVIRAKGLGRWPVNSDEYLLFQSTSFIHDTGFPMFPSGGYYVRGIALQYLMAFTTWIFPNKEFGLRIVPLCFGILTIPMFYLFCKKMIPTIPAVLCSMILVFSSWHIEFSRFARFYTTFQFMFFLFLYFFYAGYWENEKKYVWWSWGVAVISVFVFEASIFLPIIIFLLIMFRENRFHENVIRNSCYAFLLLIVNYLVNGVNYRDLGVKNALPLELVNKQSGNILSNLPINLPSMQVFLQVWSSYATIVSYCIMASFGLILFYVLTKREKPKTFWVYIFIVSTIFLPLFHLYALLGVIFVIIFINRKDVYQFYLKCMNIVNVYVILSLFYWISMIMLTGNMNKVLHYLIGYPMFRFSFVDPYLESVPIWSLYASAIIGISIVHNLFSKEIAQTRFVLTVLLVCIFIVSLFNLPEGTTRYSFFFFPLVIILGFQEMDCLINWLKKRNNPQKDKLLLKLLMAIPLFLFFITDDFHLQHVKDVSAMELNFRLGKYEQYQKHWYERYDYRTPALYVNENMKEGDSVIIGSNPFSAYLKTEFIFYSPWEADWFRQFSRNFGTVEIWSGHKMISDVPSIINAVPQNQDDSLWLIAGDQISGGYYIRDIANANHIAYARKYIGLDGRYKVWQLKKEHL